MPPAQKKYYVYQTRFHSKNFEQKSSKPLKIFQTRNINLIRIGFLLCCRTNHILHGHHANIVWAQRLAEAELSMVSDKTVPCLLSCSNIPTINMSIRKFFHLLLVTLWSKSCSECFSSDGHSLAQQDRSHQIFRYSFQFYLKEGKEHKIMLRIRLINKEREFYVTKLCTVKAN